MKVLYSYVAADGDCTLEQFKAGKAPLKITKNGKQFERGYPKTDVARRANIWPMKSDAAGCGPDQVREFTDNASHVGVPTDFTKDGRAIFTSRNHRKRYCEAVGLYDRNAGDGDPLPQNR